MSEKADSVVCRIRYFRKNKRVTVAEAYREATERKRLLIRNAGETHNRLMFIAHAMRELLRDDKFVSLLMTENLDTIPRKLAARTERTGA
jgi:ParB family chromosome partitioning protein